MEYRLTWAASSNINFHGATDWEEWDDPDASEKDIYTALEDGGHISDGLEMVLQASGFEWNVEVRSC